MERDISQEPVRFLVTSYGRTATFWIAAALHDHPEILCTHGPAMPPVVPGPEGEPGQDQCRAMHDKLDEFHATPVDVVFDAIEAMGPAKAYGNVHAYAASSVAAMRATSRRTYQVVNILRHPVGRIESFRRRFEYELSFNDHFRRRIDEYIDQAVAPELSRHVERRLGRPLERSERLHLYALSLVAQQDAADLAADVDHLAMERLTSDPEAFCWMLHKLTAGTCQPSDGYLDAVFRRGRLNVRSEQKTARRQFHSWPEWMRETFAIVSRDRRFSETYEPFRYDFSFADAEGD